MSLFAIIVKYMLIAFELGEWYGQAVMEEYMDNQLLDSVLEVIESKNTGMPTKNESSGRTVSYNLRTMKWRQAIFDKKIDFEALIPKMYEEIKEIQLNLF